MLGSFQLTASEGTLIISGATLLLAVATVWMARETRNVATHTQAEAEAVQQEAQAVLEQSKVAAAQVEVTRSALMASILPWLTAKPGIVRVTEDANAFAVRLDVVNVGSGLALIKPTGGCRIRQDARHARAGQEPVERWGHPATPVLPKDGDTTINFIVETKSAPGLFEFSGQRNSILGELYVEVDYTDARGGQATLARCHVCRSSSGAWRVASIAYYRDDQEEPFATAEFA